MFLIAILSVWIVLIFYWKWVKSYWKRKEFPFLPASFPFGTNRELALLSTYNGYVLQKIYKQLSPNPYGGILVWNQPYLLIRDPEIIRTIFVKDFQKFRNRGRVQPTPDDPLSQNLFDLDGHLWRQIRTKLTPTFTTGRIKNMFQLFEKCAENFDDHLKTVLLVNGEVINIKDLIISFTLDVILSCAFGLETNTAENRYLKKKCETIFLPYIPFRRKIKMTLFEIFPFLPKIVNIRLIDNKITDFIMNLITSTMMDRESRNIKRKDFLDLMIQLKNKGSLEDGEMDSADGKDNKDLDSFVMTIGLAAAQCFVFFAAGFETSSSVQSYALYELALNLEIQDRLHKEIDQVIERHGGTVNYDALLEMTFMEQVILETMRKYPSLPVLNRQCIKSCSMPDHPKRIIEKGTKILIPVYALHHDPKYFPDPDRFDPERFSHENKSKLVPYTYLGFGEGPRQCIGKRFGMLQTKMGLYTVLRKYKVLPTNETPKTLKFLATALVSTVAEPIKLSIKPR